MRPGRMLSRRVVGLLAVGLLAVGSAVAGGGTGGGDDGGSDSGSGGSSAPSDASYRRSLEDNSYADTYYEVWRCAVPSPGTYTTAYGKASTSTTIKSRYLAHNVRLYMDGLLLERSEDIAQRVDHASSSNYITSIPTASVSRSLSCPQALVGSFRANSWHKGISIYDNRHAFYDEDRFDG